MSEARRQTTQEETMRDLMIDLEYLAQHDDAVITQIAAVPFDITTGALVELPKSEWVQYGGSSILRLNEFPEIQEQLDEGRTIDESTMLWWMAQTANNGYLHDWAETDNTRPMADCLALLDGFVQEHMDAEEVRVFLHSRCDMGKLYHAFESNGLDSPWSYGSSHEFHLQTLRQLAKLKAIKDGDEEFIFKIEELMDRKDHDAVADCLAQIEYASLCWNYLGL